MRSQLTPRQTADEKPIVGQLVSYRVVTADNWGFGVVSRDVGGDVQVTGKLLGVQEGDTVELLGAWKTNAKYGKQFAVKSCKAVRPTGKEGVARWMASRLPNVGRERALQILERFGDAVWDVMESEPERLAEIDGITAKRAIQIGDAYRENILERDAMIELKGWDLTDHQVSKCLEVWGTLSRVIEALRGDPYQLCEHVGGFGFLRADVVAMKMGVPKESQSRIRAAIDHKLREGAGLGHVYIAGGALQRMVAQMLDVDAVLVGKEILGMGASGRVTKEAHRVYRPELHKAEAGCAHSIRRLLGKIEQEDAA